MKILEWVSSAFVLSGLLSAVVIALDLREHRQTMRIMEPVWVLTGLWGGVIALWAYYAFGRVHAHVPEEMHMPEHPRWQSVVLSTLHCGAGCTLADLLGEWLLFFVPVTIGGSLLAGNWTTDYLLALILGIGFQYAAIRSMSHVNRGDAVIRAAKADFFSLTAWQAGMCGWMAVAIFAIFGGWMPPRTSWTFWFMMQVAMYVGFVLSLPVNVMLVRKGIKHAM